MLYILCNVINICFTIEYINNIYTLVKVHMIIQNVKLICLNSFLIYLLLLHYFLLQELDGYFYKIPKSLSDK